MSAGEIQVGAGASVDPAASIEPGCEIGANAVIGSGASIGPDVVVGAGAIVEAARIGPSARIGANAVVPVGSEVGAGAVVEPGAIVDGSVPREAIVRGNPARIIGYVQGPEGTTVVPETGTTTPSPRVVPGTDDDDGARLIACTVARDLRGSLTAIEEDSPLPFSPARAFLVYDVPGEEVRGEHAHRECHQFLIAVSGSVHAIADDGSEKREFVLDAPTFGLYLPPMVWGTQYRYSGDCVLLVLASHRYDADDYIRTYAEFEQALADG